MAGEQSGNLPGTIGRYIQYAKIIARTKSRIRSALIYPTLLLVFSFVLLGVLVNFVLPRFADFYKDFESELPALTTALIALRHGRPPATSCLILLAVGLVVLAFLRLGEQGGGPRRLRQVQAQDPLGRMLWRESAVSLFSRTLGLLLEAGHLAPLRRRDRLPGHSQQVPLART